MHANIFLKLVDILNEDEYPRQICREKSVEIILFFPFCFSIYIYIKKRGKKTDHIARIFAKIEKRMKIFSFACYFQLEKRDY